MANLSFLAKTLIKISSDEGLVYPTIAESAVVAWLYKAIYEVYPTVSQLCEINDGYLNDLVFSLSKQGEIFTRKSKLIPGSILIFVDGTKVGNSCVAQSFKEVSGYNQINWFSNKSSGTSLKEGEYSTHSIQNIMWQKESDKAVNSSDIEHDVIQVSQSTAKQYFDQIMKENSVPSTFSVNAVPIKRFFKLKANTNDRVIMDFKDKIPKPKLSSKLVTRRGWSLFGQGDSYESENVEALTQFFQSMESEYGKDGLLACKQLQQKLEGQHRLSCSDILFAYKNIIEIKRNRAEFINLQHLFINIGHDPRLAAILDGESFIISQLKKQGKGQIQKKIPKIDGIPVAKFALSIGSMITDSNISQQEYNVFKALNHHKMRNPLGVMFASMLDKNHAYAAESTSIKTTCGIITSALAVTGVTASMGTLMIAHAVGHGVAGKSIEGKMSAKLLTMAQSKAEKGIITGLPSKYSKKLPTNFSLPRIVINDSKGYRYFELKDTETIVKFLAYLGPKKTEDITKLEADFPGIKAGEEARLAFKKELGSPNSEDIVVGKPSLTSKSDKILKSQMQSNQLSSFLANIKLGLFYQESVMIKYPTLFDKSAQVSSDFVSTGGVPSALYLLLLAENQL